MHYLMLMLIGSKQTIWAEMSGSALANHFPTAMAAVYQAHLQEVAG